MKPLQAKLSENTWHSATGGCRYELRLASTDACVSATLTPDPRKAARTAAAALGAGTTPHTAFPSGLAIVRVGVCSRPVAQRHTHA